MPVSNDSSESMSQEKRRTLARLGALSLAPVLPELVLASTIHALPRAALIFGNSTYPDMPLNNPVNDASAIAAELKRLGFSVDLQIDAKRTVMEESIRNFSAYLAKTRGVGLFYFAGHGLQLDWRNFLLPVDARLRRPDDVARQTVDLGSVLNSLGKAGNQMNIVVLDACRDNPFGTDHKTGKGLSQMDAPIGTLLAYATAPGNVASDGTGKNGLYTENLLREMVTPETKIEDVFKRVRLAVRRSSQGQQIPWESTSLEEDFYFIPPATMRKHSQEELDRLFAEELALWDQVQKASQPEPLTAYLKAYPSGRFSELAQVKLDRLLAKEGEKPISLVSDERNPFTKGSAVAGKYRLGDRFTFRVVDLLTKIQSREYIRVVTEITDSEVIFNRGAVITDLLGNPQRTHDGRRISQSQSYISEYSLGKTWRTRYRITSRGGQEDEFEEEFRVVAREEIVVPAGTFHAFRVNSFGHRTRGSDTLKRSYWVAPEKTASIIAHELIRRNSRGQYLTTDRTELVSFTPRG